MGAGACFAKNTPMKHVPIAKLNLQSVSNKCPKTKHKYHITIGVYGKHPNPTYVQIATKHKVCAVAVNRSGSKTVADRSKAHAINVSFSSSVGILHFYSTQGLSNWPTLSSYSWKSMCRFHVARISRKRHTYRYNLDRLALNTPALP